MSDGAGGPEGRPERAARPIRALLVAGGCCHDYENQKGLLTRGLSRRANIQWTIAYDPKSTTRHKNPETSHRSRQDSGHRKTS